MPQPLSEIIATKRDLVAKKMNNYIESDSGCWEWQGPTQQAHKGEYGRVSIKLGMRSYKIGAHRLAYYFHTGENPGELCVCHTCDNPKCINPDHLFLGTRKQNMDDMVKKGRHGAGPNRVTPKLERLTESELAEMASRI